MVLAEKVARAIYDSIDMRPKLSWSDTDHNYRAKKIAEARVAIAAMRDPPKNLQDEAGWYYEDCDLVAWWNKLIDAALKE